MKRPLLIVGLLIIAGILFGEAVSAPLPLLFGSSLAVAAAALIWNRGRPWLLGILLFLTGWTDARWHHAILSPCDLRGFLDEQPRFVTVRGTVQAPPSQRIFERDQREFWHSSAVIEGSEILYDGQWRPAAGRIVAVTQGILPPGVFEGQQVEVSGTIQPPRGPVAEGMFDSRAFYKREGVFFQLQTSGPADWKTPASELPFAERFRQWARRTLALDLPEEDEALRLTWTLLLDWKAPLTTTVEEPFLRAGTYHIFAVDGLRIGLLAVIGIGLMRLLQLPRSVCGALVLPALWFYAGLTGWPASAVRAAIMASVIIVGWACRRPADLINSLFAAAGIVLLWDPAQLFQPGFQLSFLVVLCIAVLVPKLRHTLHGWLFKADPFLPADLQTRWPGWLHASAAYAVDTLAMSVAAWIGSIPLAAYYFHLFTPVSVPANCVVVPVTALALMSGMGSLLTGAWFPALAGLFNNATWVLLKFIIWFSQWAAQWPGGNFNVATPSIFACVLFYAALILLGSGWIFRSRRKWVISAAWLTAAAAGCVHWAMGFRDARLDILPMNGAPVVCASAPGLEGTFLVDCGSDESSRQLLKPFLCAQGVNHLAGLCLAVGRLDYFGGARLILENFRVKGIFSGAPQNRSAAFRSLTHELSHGKGWRAVRDGDQIEGWTVLHPGPADQFSQADDNAVVLLREFNGHTVILLPALGRDGQDALMRRHPDLRAEFVIAGLPAREEPLCGPLLDMLRPGIIVIADAKFPATRRASFKLRQRLATRETRIIYGRDNGALTLAFNARGWSLCAADGSPAVESPQVKDGESP